MTGDEPKAAKYVRQRLTVSGYVVEVAHSGTDGHRVSVTRDYELITLKVMFPGIDGFAVLSALRTLKQVTVLKLSVRGKTDDKVRRFYLGAKDYLVQPIQFSEPLRRVRTVL